MGWLINFFKRFFPNLFNRLGGFIVGFIGPLLGPVLAFAAQFFKKVAIFFLILAAVTTAVNVFVDALMLLFGEVVEGIAPEFFTVGRMFIPSNLSFCVSLLVLAKIKSLIFYWVHRFSEQFIHT